MKKSLLISAAILAASTATAYATPMQSSFNKRAESPFFVSEQAAPAKSSTTATRASGSYEFSYSGEVNSALTLNGTTPGTTIVYLATEIQAADLKVLAGNKISAITVTGGTVTRTNGSKANPVGEVDLFITRDLNQAPLMKQHATLSTEAFGQNIISLDTPYEITESDTKLYVGYSLKVASSKAYYIPIDGIEQNASYFIYGTSNSQSLPSSWTEAGLMGYGSLCLSMTITGDNLPKDAVSLIGIDAPTSMKPGTPASYKLTVRNPASNDVNSFEVTTTAGTTAPVAKTITLDQALAPNQMATYTIPEAVFESNGSQTLTASITKVNGKATDRVSSISTTVMVYDNGFDRNIVVEEGTGTWCGWCPSGTVMLEYMTRTYPDRMFGIACHQGDAMSIPAYQGFIADNFSGFPASLTNRVVDHSPGTTAGPQGNYAFIDRMYEEFTSAQTYCEIKITPSVNTDINTGKKTMTVNATAEFAFDMEKKHYLSFVITENLVGPYSQANYYAGGGNGKMDGWENQKSNVSVLFNDVARAYVSYPGIEGSLPEKIEAGNIYSYSAELPMDKVVGPYYAVIGFITNAETGEIVNATRYTTYEVGVNDIVAEGAENLEVFADGGSIRVPGAKNVEVYTLDGRRTGIDGLAKGLYIVIADGKSFKVMMR